MASHMLSKMKRYVNEIDVSTNFLTFSKVIFSRQDLSPGLLFTCGNAMLLVLAHIN